MPLTTGEGPIGLIICPSRELARQVPAPHSCCGHTAQLRILPCMSQLLSMMCES